MSKYSRYGSYFLANEKDDENTGELNITAKPINRKRYDFVNDTDPENFADNLSDEELPDETPEEFPLGDISDEPDDPSDNIEPFPDDSTEDELSELNNIPDFPGEDEELNDEIEDFPDEDTPGEFPTDSDDTEDLMKTFPGEDGGTDANIVSDNDNPSSSDIISDGNKFLDDIIKNKIGDRLPTPDEIIDDLRKKVYGDNPPEATQINDNNSNIPDFPTDSADNNIANVDAQNPDIPAFPGEEQNPMSATVDNSIPTTPADNTTADTNMNNPIGEFPDETPPTGGTDITANPADTGIEGFPGDNTDFTAGATTPDMGGEMTPGAPGVPVQQPGPGVGYDSMRKYNLYKEYNKLLEAIGNYITRLENLMFDEPHQNLIVKTVIDKLNEVKKLCYDYITMKFEIASYTQSYVFFEELAVSIQVIFTILMTISSYNTNQNGTRKKKTTKKSNDKK